MRTGAGFLIATGAWVLAVSPLSAYTAGKAGVCEVAADLENLQPGEWCEARAVNNSWNSRLSAIAPGANVVRPWSGGAFVHNPTKGRNDLVIWGGGHGDYWGNELYAFNVETLAWRRINPPSTPDSCDNRREISACGTSTCGGSWDPAGNNGNGICVGGNFDGGFYLADGEPRSNHSYDNLEYIPSIDRFVAVGISGGYPTGQTGTSTLLAYNFDRANQSDEWERKSQIPYGGMTDAITAIDPDTGLLWGLGGGNSVLCRWNPQTDVWTSFTGVNRDNGHTGAAGDGVFLALGNGRPIYVWNLASPNSGPVTPPVTGNTTVLGRYAPGLEFDPLLDVFAGWAGGTAVYKIDASVSGVAITPDALAPTNTVNPGPVNPTEGNGTFGRWRRVPSLASRHIFVLVNSVDQNVYFYRLSGGAAPEPSTPARPRRLRVR